MIPLCTKHHKTIDMIRTRNHFTFYVDQDQIYRISKQKEWLFCRIAKKGPQILKQYLSLLTFMANSHRKSSK